MKLSRNRPKSRQHKILIPTGIALLLIAGVFGVLKFNDIFSPGSENLASQNNDQNPDNNDAKEQSGSDHQAEQNAETIPKDNQNTNPSLSEAGNNWWVVNKTRPLDPVKYQPSDLVFPSVSLRVPGNESMKLRSEPSQAVEKLFSAAKSAGYNPMFSSGFRSYAYQVNLYNGYVNSQGQAEADKQSARPGYSEHQTGLAFDICDASDCDLAQSFGSTPFGQWVANNAHQYGFTVRYKENKQNITGYIYEPWHLRYVGADLATKLYNSNQTIEEYFGLPAAPDYK